MKTELLRKSIKKRFLMEIIIALVTAISMIFLAWAIGMPTVIILFTFVIMACFIFLYLLTYLIKKPMLIMYEKLEKELGEYEIIKVLTGEKYNIKSKPSLLILTKKNELFRIQVLNNKDYIQENVKS